MTASPTLAEVEAAAEEVRLCGGVEAVDVIETDTRFADRRPTLEAVVTGAYRRVPPRVLRALAEADLGVWSVDRQAGGEAFIVVAC
jgi:hypothetical protein